MNVIERKNSSIVSLSTLTLALTFILASTLTLTLTLTWVLSLREVRLKIADYYYDQGKFKQAANWYEKVVRKEKLKLDPGGTTLLKYESDLTKFKFALGRLNNENLLSIDHHLGIEKTIDVNLKKCH